MVTVLSLIALVLAYKIFLEASKEKEGVKILGQVIGIFAMVAAVILLLWSACPKSGLGKSGCAYASKRSCGAYGSKGGQCAHSKPAALLQKNCPYSDGASS